MLKPNQLKRSDKILQRLLYYPFRKVGRLMDFSTFSAYIIGKVRVVICPTTYHHSHLETLALMQTEEQGVHLVPLGLGISWDLQSMSEGVGLLPLVLP